MHTYMGKAKNKTNGKSWKVEERTKNKTKSWNILISLHLLLSKAMSLIVFRSLYYFLPKEIIAYPSS